MAFNETKKIELPDSFPGVTFDALWRRSRDVLAMGGPARNEFNNSSNLVAWRYRACCEYFDAYRRSWEQFGFDVSFEEIYSRERDLYGMFAAGISCIETTTYTVYALVSQVLNLPFDQREQYSAGPGRLLSALKSTGGDSSLVRALEALVNAPEWKTWTLLRNRMTHRSNLPRIIKVALGNTRPAETKAFEYAGTTSTTALDGDLDTLQSLLDFLTGSLAAILGGASEIAQSQPSR